MSYEIFNSYIVRTPLFPYDFLKKNTFENICEIAKNEIFQEAIFLASPILYEELIKWINNQLSDKKNIDRLILALSRYLSRMCTRSSPFGMFAGLSVVDFTQNEDRYLIQLDDISNHKRYTRLDMNFLCALTLDIVKIDNVKRKLKFYPNQSIYIVDDQVRYIEYKYINNRRIHTISAVDNSEYLQRIIQLAKNGVLYDEMVHSIVDDEITIEEASEFVSQIIENQILVNELEPAITGGDFVNQISSVLNDIPEAENIHKILSDVQLVIKNIDNKIFSQNIENYNLIQEKLKNLGTNFEKNYLFQVDLKKEIKNIFFSKNIEADFKDVVNVLGKLCDWYKNINLENFKKAFVERYEEQEVPLLKVLDNECGLGYLQDNLGSNDIALLVDDLSLPIQKNENPNNSFTWNKKQSFLFAKLKEFIKTDSLQIEIHDKDIEELNFEVSNLPLTFSVMGKIVDFDEDALKPIFQLYGLTGSSAANLLGRFCHMDKSLMDYTKKITKKEQDLRKDVIFAEIIHLPESRTGNVIMRPVLRDYEIPYLAMPGVEKEFQILPEDLIISVKNDRIILRSKRLNKEIIPRLSNAHNFVDNSLPLYHFLGDMQNQGVQGGASFEWGVLQNQFDYLPRLVYKNFILTPASWRIKKKNILKLIEDIDSPVFMANVKEWVKQNKLVQRVVFVDFDNELYVDFDNELSVRALLSVIKNREDFKLNEFIFNNENPVVKSTEGALTNEFIFAFHKN